MPLIFGPIGMQELLLLILLIVIFFGAKKLPQLGAGLGSGIRNFKESLSSKDDKKIEDSGEEHKA